MKPQLRPCPAWPRSTPSAASRSSTTVLVRPEALVKYNLTLRQVFEALAANNVNGAAATSSRRRAVRDPRRRPGQGIARSRTSSWRARDGIAVRIRDRGRGDGGLGDPAGRRDQGRPGRGGHRHRHDAARRELPDGRRRRQGRVAQIAKSLPRRRDAQAVLRPDRPGRPHDPHGRDATCSRAPLLVIAVLFLSSATSGRPSSWPSSIPLSMLFAVSLHGEARHRRAT